MSDCGGLLVAALAAPLILVVLLVAGLSFVALQSAKLVGQLAVEGINFATQSIATAVRAATQAVTAAGVLIGNTTARGAEWTRNLFESTQMGERLRRTAHTTYQVAAREIESLATRQTVSLEALPSAPALTGGATGTLLASPVSSAAAVLPATASSARRETIDLLARAQAVASALDAELPMKLVAAQLYSARLSAARTAVDSARSCLLSGEVEKAHEHAARAESLFTTVTHDAHQRLRAAERATVTAQVGNTLQDLGYEVKLASSKENTAIVGRRQHHALAMVIRPGGQMEFDMAGFEGDSCQSETHALLEALRRNGLSIQSETITRHGRFGGGALIRKAQRHGKPLEVALAETFPLTDEEQRETVPNAPVRRTASLDRGESEHERLQRGRAFFWSQAQVRN